MGIASASYHAVLSVHFLLVLRRGWTEADLRRIEPYLHAVPVLWSVGTAVAGWALGRYGNATRWCWIKADYDQYRWAFFYAPLWAAIPETNVHSVGGDGGEDDEDEESCGQDKTAQTP